MNVIKILISILTRVGQVYSVLKLHNMLFLLFIPICIVACWILNYFWYNRYLKMFPGPIPLPVVGSALNFINLKNIIPQLLKYREKYNGDFKVFLGFKPAIFISDLKSLEALLNSTTNLKKPEEYKFLKNWLGNGLLLSDGEYWRKHRKIITQAFHFQILERYIEVFNEVSEALIKSLEKKIGQEAFDIYPYITWCALDIICEAAMGTPVNALKNSESEYVNSVKQMGRIVMYRLFSVIQKYDVIYRFSDYYKIEKEALEILHNYSHNVIKRRKQENKDIISEEDLTSKKRLAFLDLLLYHNSKTNSLDDYEIREEVDTLLFAGHDTTASAVSFVLYNLANHQDIQEKVYQEIKTINSTGALTYNCLKEMQYLELVIKESLRLYPPVPLYAKQLTTDIQCADKILPKGMFAIINAICIHRDSHLYPNPEKFDPDRFSPENSRNRNQYAFIPFSAGARNCIGQKFAMFEIKSVISNLLRHYQLLPTIPAQKLELIPETVLRSNNGVMIRLEKR